MQKNRMQEVLVAYDVEDNKARTRLLNQLKDIGLIPIQKSVLWGRLLPAEVTLVKRLFRQELDAGSDRAFIVKSPFKDKAHLYGNTSALEQYDEPAIF